MGLSKRGQYRFSFKLQATFDEENQLRIGFNDALQISIGRFLVNGWKERHRNGTERLKERLRFLQEATERLKKRFRL